MARRVRTPDGIDWKVGREWAPWRMDLRGDGELLEMPDLPGFGGGDELGAIFLVIALAILLVVAVVLGWFVIALAIELLVLLAGAIVAAIGRVLFRKPWTVRARAGRGDDREEHRWHVRGWSASGAKVDEVAGALEHGLPLPQPE